MAYPLFGYHLTMLNDFIRHRSTRNVPDYCYKQNDKRLFQNYLKYLSNSKTAKTIVEWQIV
jgi:hypothetical protein